MYDPSAPQPKRRSRKLGWSLTAAAAFFVVQQVLTLIAVSTGQAGAGTFLRIVLLAIGGFWFFTAWSQWAHESKSGGDIIGQFRNPRRNWRGVMPVLALLAMPMLFGVGYFMQWYQGPSPYGVLREQAETHCADPFTGLGVFEYGDEVVAVRGASDAQAGRVTETKSTADPDYDRYRNLVIEGRSSRITQVLCIVGTDGRSYPRRCVPHRTELFDAATGASLGSANLAPSGHCTDATLNQHITFEAAPGATPRLAGALDAAYDLAKG